jgi:hypothetical protein
MRREVELLGSGGVLLGEKIDWHCDFKTGDRWPVRPFQAIDYVNRNRASDVKTVWELSRLQWLLPCGQAYLLTANERYAEVTRHTLESWIQANPYWHGVNWAVAMEPALRIVSWTWMLKAFGSSVVWRDRQFRQHFLRSLFLHAIYTERYIERTDICGNHFTAEAVGLVVAGFVFGPGEDADRWLTTGIEDLEREIVRQVHEDGVDFEASVAYHRLVAELFLYGAIFARAAGRAVSRAYCDRLQAMARFASAYTRLDGSTPLAGDADDGRLLPMGGQSLNDHRYLPGLIGLFLDDSDLIDGAGGPRSEACWLFGASAASKLKVATTDPGPKAFDQGGFYVLRSGGDHVFLDCGPLGLAGRGGHDHNDMLSFEAALDGEIIVSDRGTYTYTGDFASRNEFRGTASHNTPQIDGQEINRFTNPEWLWSLENDAHPREVSFRVSEDYIVFRGSHDGYTRLDGAPAPHRTVTLRPSTHELTVRDEFSGDGVHSVRIPVHLAPGISVEREGRSRLTLKSTRRQFQAEWRSGGAWELAIESGSISPTYGVLLPALNLVWSSKSKIQDLWMEISIRPTSSQV